MINVTFYPHHSFPPSGLYHVRPRAVDVELDGEWMVMGVEGPIPFPVIRDAHKPNSGA